MGSSFGKEDGDTLEVFLIVRIQSVAINTEPVRAAGLAGLHTGGDWGGKAGPPVVCMELHLSSPAVCRWQKHV